MGYHFINNKNILITGGTGSLGRELVCKILHYNPKVARVFDVDELDEDSVIGIEEKPEVPKLNYAVVGLYMYYAQCSM